MLKDFAVAVRLLRTRPRFAAGVALLLALGIGPNVAIFSVVYTVLVRPLPFDRGEQIVYLWEALPELGLRRSAVSPANFPDWRERNTVFQQMAAFRTWFYTVAGYDEPEQLWGVRVSASFFDLLRVTPALGRRFLAEEEVPGRDGVVLISDGLWRRRFAADPSISGRSIAIDERPYMVVGVLPQSFNLFGGSRQFDLWMPFDFTLNTARDNYSILAFARLGDGVSVAQAQAEMGSIARQLEREHPATNKGHGVEVVRFQNNYAEPVRPALLLLLAAVGSVLVIACANAANLLLAHAVRRQREFAVRRALGATRWRLARQSLTEALALAVPGCALGLLLASWTLSASRAVSTTGGGEIPRSAYVRLDLPVLAFALGLCLLTALIVGFAPAVTWTRKTSAAALNESGRGSTDARTGRARSALITAQVALALVLLVGAGLTLRSLYRLLELPSGISPKNVLTMQVWLPEAKYPDGERVAQFYARLLDRLASLPGVESAGAVNFLPFSGWGDAVTIRGTDAATSDPARRAWAQYRIVAGDYVTAVGIQRRRGRWFTTEDHAESLRTAVVNETFVRRHWPALSGVEGPGSDPIGKRIELQFSASPAPWHPVDREDEVTVIGVAADVREGGFGGFGETPAPQVYLSGTQFPSRLMRLAIRTTPDPATLTSGVKRVLHDVDARQAVTEVKTMEQFIVESVAWRRLNLTVLAALAAVAFAVAIGGIWSVVSYTTAQRTREIGIRLTLGAEPRSVLRLIVRQALRPVLAGTALGLAAALAVARVLEGLLFGVTPTDPTTYVAVGVLFVIVAAAACWIPARQATKVDPSVALRCE